MDEFSLVTLNSAHAGQVSKLRTEAYRRRYGERADVERLKWSPNDERFLNIGLLRKRDGELVSIIRLAFLKTPLDFYKVVLLKHDPNRFELPLVVIGRVATAVEYEGKGLHGILRWAGLLISKKAGAKSIVGTMEEGSLRLKQMGEIGYEFLMNEEPWEGYLKNEKPIVVGILYADHRLDRGCEILAERFRERKILFTDEIDYATATDKLRSTESFVD
ncbi:hypothetical protein BH10BDE1_BH10BDE1_20920 [soil metagenome]